MKKGYTFNFLLKYIYHETSATKTLEIENAINEDAETCGYYRKLLKGFKMLPKVQFYPSDDSIANVLNYSSKSQLNPSF